MARREDHADISKIGFPAFYGTYVESELLLVSWFLKGETITQANKNLHYRFEQSITFPCHCAICFITCHVESAKPKPKSLPYCRRTKSRGNTSPF